jgi:hypothetical protein
MQPKLKHRKMLAYPIQLNKMAGLGSNIIGIKTNQNAYVVYEDLAMKIDAEIKKIKDIVDKDEGI